MPTNRKEERVLKVLRQIKDNAKCAFDEICNTWKESNKSVREAYFREKAQRVERERMELIAKNAAMEEAAQRKKKEAFWQNYVAFSIELSEVLNNVAEQIACVKPQPIDIHLPYAEDYIFEVRRTDKEERNVGVIQQAINDELIERRKRSLCILQESITVAVRVQKSSYVLTVRRRGGIYNAR
jgi:antitoxin component of RelBE/YafQ-DinJ toxin-antitoxin module